MCSNSMGVENCMCNLQAVVIITKLEDIRVYELYL